MDLFDETVDDYGDVTRRPIDLTDTVQALMKFRAKGASVLTDTLPGQILTPPHAGQVKFSFTPLSLAGGAGNYEGEVELTQFGGGIFTVYDTLKFKVRLQF
jgi:hypothetical protein